MQIARPDESVVLAAEGKMAFGLSAFGVISLAVLFFFSYRSLWSTQ